MEHVLVVKVDINEVFSAYEQAMDRFKANEDCVMVATDVAARGLDVAGIRTVIHYQLPHSAEVCAQADMFFIKSIHLMVL